MLRGALGFLASGAVIAVGIALMSNLSPRHQLTAVVSSFLLGGALAGAWLASTIFGTWRPASILCSAAGFALGGSVFTILTAAQAKSSELMLSAGLAWAAGGLLIGAGFTHWDRSLLLVVLGPMAFGAAGVVSWLVMESTRHPSLSLAAASFVTTVLGGTLFSAAAALLKR